MSVTKGGRQTLEFLAEAAVNLMISDPKMPTLGGIKLGQEINRKRIDIPVLFITACGEMESDMDLMNMGAFEYLNRLAKSRESLPVMSEAIDARANSPGGSCSWLL